MIQNPAVGFPKNREIYHEEHEVQEGMQKKGALKSGIQFTRWVKRICLLKRLQVPYLHALHALHGDLYCGFWDDRPVNWHEVIDERALEMDAVIACVLRADPSKLDLVVAWIEKFLTDPDYSLNSKEALKEWLVLIRKGLPAVLAVLADRSEEGRRLRQNSPFAILMPQDERKRILAKYEALRPSVKLQK